MEQLNGIAFDAFGTLFDLNALRTRTRQAGGHEGDVRVTVDLGEQRRVALDDPRGRPVGADVGELEAAGHRALLRGPRDRVLVAAADDDLGPLALDRRTAGRRPWR